MKIIANKLTTIVATISILTSCSKLNTVVDIKAPETPNVLVVNALFSNDSLLTVNVSKTANFFKAETPEIVTGALCKIYANDVFVENLSYTQNGYYKASFIPAHGVNYEIKIAAANFTDVSAKGAMPLKPSFSNVKCYVDSVNKIFNFVINDTDTAKNYYSITLMEQEFDKQGNFVAIRPVTFRSNTDKGNPLASNDEEGEEIIYEDALFNGKEFAKALAFRSNANRGKGAGPHGGGPQSNTTSKFNYFGILKNTSKEMYNYRKTLKTQDSNNGNPFAEPTQIYNNVTNGLGIFAGYSFELLPITKK
jgi:hypothetical protein